MQRITMPEPCSPGVYVEESSPTVRTIAAVPSSRTAFLGTAAQGPIKEPVSVHSIDKFIATFGGPNDGTLGPAVDLFFANGGTEAIVVRLHKPELKVTSDKLLGKASSPAGRKIVGGRHKSGLPLDAGSFIGKDGGIRVLDRVVFNLLCILPYQEGGGIDIEVLKAAAAYCAERKAMLLIDAPREWSDVRSAEQGAGGLRDALGAHARNAALYFPHLRRQDGMGVAITDVPASAAVAAIIARTDAQRGVWRAPAGREAQVRGAEGLAIALRDVDIDRLNPLGVNCLRSMPEVGVVVWGARTLEGSDASCSEWKYLSVRRLALFIEESLRQGLQWTVFEPNDQALWSGVRLSAEGFLLELFRRGAFQGAVPRDAYFVRCGADTTPPSDIEKGLLGLQIGFAPLRPAEFIILRVQLRAGGSEPRV